MRVLYIPVSLGGRFENGISSCKFMDCREKLFNNFLDIPNKLS